MAVAGNMDFRTLNKVLARVKATAAGYSSECWNYQGALNQDGYGLFFVGKRKFLTHRLVYTLLRNCALPKGIVLDHLCRNRACCNPEHLEPVDIATNVLRGIAPTIVAHIKGECLKGHDMTNPANVKSGPKGNQCRRCWNDRRNERRAKARQTGAVYAARYEYGELLDFPF